MGFYSSHGHQGSDDRQIPRDRKTEDVDSVSVAAHSNQSHDDFLADGSKDYTGQIAKRSTTGGWRTAPLIFGPETCEKMAVVGVVINFVPYLKGSLHLSSSYSANLVTTYQGTSYILTLVGGFIADTRLGRYTVIVGAATVQFTGLLLLTLSASLPALKPKPCVNTSSHRCPAQTGTPFIVMYISVYLLAIGTGGIKACASAFGADQFDSKHETERKNLAGFFSWYFFGISCGAVVATTGLVWIQDNEGRNWGYLVPTLAMLVVAVAFVSGRRLYRFKEPKGSPLSQILQVFVAAHRNRRLQLPAAGSDGLYELDEGSRPYDYVRMERSQQFRFLDKAAIVLDPGRNAKLGEKPRNEIPNKNASSLWRLNTVTRVEETKMVIRLMPILLTTSLFYTVYAQSTTFSVEQGSTMNRKLGATRFEISAASMAAFTQGSILLTLYLWEKAVVPAARRFTGLEKGTTSLQRIGVGLVVSVVTMGAAAMVERRRMHYVKAEGLERRLGAGDDPGAHVGLSVFWLLPQYVLSGAGEALTYAGQLDFFYNESPKAMRSMGSALCICTLSLGYYTSSFLVSVVNKATGRDGPNGSRSGSWLPDSIGTSGRLDKFYWLLAVASIGNFLLFLACAHWYRYKTEAPAGKELKGSTRDVEISIRTNPADRRAAQDS